MQSIHEGILHYLHNAWVLDGFVYHSGIIFKPGAWSALVLKVGVSYGW